MTVYKVVEYPHGAQRGEEVTGMYTRYEDAMSHVQSILLEGKFKLPPRIIAEDLKA